MYVRHDSVESGSPCGGNAFKDVVSGEPDLLVTKHVNSAFYGDPELHEWLQEADARSRSASPPTTA